MNKNKLKRNRPDYDGIDRGIFSHNKAILRKTATVCALCGMPFDKTLKYPNPLSISIDHIIPVTLGGKSTLDNLQATHLICNKIKGKKVLLNGKSDDSNIKPPYKKEKSIPQYIDWTNYEG